MTFSLRLSPRSRTLRALILALCTQLSAQSLEIRKIDIVGDAVSIEVPAEPDLYYVLDALDSATGNRTGSADIQLGENGVGTLTDSQPAGSSGLYRVRAFSRQFPNDTDGDGIDDLYELSRDSLHPLNPDDASLPRPFDGGTTTEAEAYLNNYEVGRGRYDVTGEAAGGSMMGYADGDQVSSGIHDRQWARAFIVRDRMPPHRRVVFVVVDNGQVFQSISQGVFDKIRADNELNEYYSYENVVLSATHTHGAGGGHSHFALFHASIGGYKWRVYDALVHGIYMAIKKAHRDLAPGRIVRNSGELADANENRRPNAFEQNVEHQFPGLLGNPHETDHDEHDNRDTEMLCLRFENGAGDDLAMFNWFPVHGVSVSKENTLLTGDNKGNAAYLFERQKGAIYPGHEGYNSNTSTFVAGFANSNPGDMTANRRNLEDNWPANGENDYWRASTIGGRQFQKALDLHEGNEGTPAKVTGTIDYRHMYVDMSQVAVDPPSLYPYNVPGVGFGGSDTVPPWHTCVGALGFEFAKGTLDGEALSQTAVDALILGFPNDPVTQILEICQYPKDIILTTTGLINLTPQWLPISILKVGDVAILAVPAEFTVMAAWRLRKTVEQTFAAEGQQVRTVLAGLSNSYSGYVTTYEEYLYEELIGEVVPVPNQGYEAASTHFGAFTLAAYQTKFTELARSMARGTEVPAAPGDVQMPAHARPDVPFVNPLDKLPVVDVAPLPTGIPATFHEQAGCPDGQFWDLLTGDCWSCPDDYERTVFPIETGGGEPSDNGCEKPAFSLWSSATEHGAAGCAVGQFFDVGTGDCWSCPSGFNRSVLPIVDLISGEPSDNGCHKPPSSEFTAALSTSSSGGIDCPDGYVYDFILGRCYKCPSGYNKNVTRAWNNAAACEKQQSTSADSTAGTGFFGTDCPNGYVYDLILGRCYKCPSSYSKHVLRAWNANNACVGTVTTAANNTTSSGGTDCPDGYVYDFILGECYKCPGGYNKTILRGWNHAAPCEKVIPEEWTAATRYDAGLCPNGQFLDIGLGTCWSCPDDYTRTVLPVTGDLACEKVVSAVRTAATRHGKFHCDQRDPDWFLDIGRGECWSCPEGSIRNLNPVDGGEACSILTTWGMVRSGPAGSYSKDTTASVSFWAGHPKNVFGTFADGLTNGVRTFLKVQRKIGGSWKTVKTDADWDTTFEYGGVGLSGAATIKWVIPADAEPGTYRITHHGYWGDLGGVEPYSGTSPEFQVTD